MNILRWIRLWWYMRRPFMDQAGNTWRTCWVDGEMVHRKLGQRPRRVE